MYSTKHVVMKLARANPGVAVDEERVRRAIRTGAICAPRSIAGRYVWTDREVAELTKVLGLRAPEGETRGGAEVLQ